MYIIIFMIMLVGHCLTLHLRGHYFYSKQTSSEMVDYFGYTIIHRNIENISVTRVRSGWKKFRTPTTANH